MKRFLAFILFLTSLLAAFSQRDTVVTRLREVAVVGLKQQAESELAATTTISAPEIQRLGIVKIKDISELAPNFFLPDYGSRMTSSIYVRGLGARIDQPVVGLNVDGVTYLNKDNYDFDLVDIERIEVLRGPQAILNGRNTMGGQINIVTLSPWRFSGLRLMAEYGRGHSAKASLGWYGRLSPTMASSLSGYFTMTDGFFRNAYDGARIDTERQGSVRWKLSWHPADRLSIANVAAAQISRQGGLPYENLASGLISYNDFARYSRNSLTDALTIGWTGKRVIVNSVTSFQYIDDCLHADQDFLPDPYFTLMQDRKEWALTQDLYTRGNRGADSWLGGVFGFYKHSRMLAPVTFKDTGISDLIEAHPNQMNPDYPLAWDSRQFTLGSRFTTLTKGIAFYARNSYITGNWTFELGLRYDLEHASLIYDSNCSSGYTIYHRLPSGALENFAHVPVEIADHGHLSRTFSELLPKFTVGYRFPAGIKLYANVSKAYKAGGYNSQMFSDVLQQRIMEMMGLTMKYDVDDIVSYRPEKSWNYEIGAEFSHKLLTAKADLFFISCTDQQLTAFPDGLTTGRIMTNAGRTRSFGAELSLDLFPLEGLTLRGSYGFTNATFRQYNNGKEDFRGKRLPYAPANTLFLSANYELPCRLLGATPGVEASVRGIGDIMWNEENTLRQPFYATLGAAISLGSDRWNIRLWGENLTATRYCTFYFKSIGNEFVQRARPWTVGVTLRLNFPKL